MFFTANLACISAFNFILSDEKWHCSHLFAGAGDTKIELDNKVLFQGEKVFKLWWSFWVEPEAIHNVQITFVSKALLSFSQQPLWLWWNIQLLGTSKSIINNCIINYSLCVLISKEALITLIRFKIFKKKINDKAVSRSFCMVISIATSRHHQFWSSDHHHLQSLVSHFCVIIVISYLDHHYYC